MIPSPLPRIAVVIPCYKVAAHIAGVLAAIGPEVNAVYVIDDACPEHSGKQVEATTRDSRVRVLYHAVNKGVGGAVITGYRRAIEDGAEIIVKIDGDGQMDCSLIPLFIRPIAKKEADYTKGNRFYQPDDVLTMPLVRLIGNACLSFLTKFSSGYWNIFDPTNGFTAIDARVAKYLPLAKISERYFFESDILFRLNTVRAVIMDIPMPAIYGDETSSLRINKIFFPFLLGNIRNFGKRIFYNYFLRNMSMATIELVVGLALLLFGVTEGISAWRYSAVSHIPSTAGTVMLASLPIILGFQLLLSFLSADIASTPQVPLVKRLRD